MPLNDKKIISIIFEQCERIDERCAGYKKELIDVIADILEYERGHRVSATNIQKKINERCNTAAKFLVMRRGHESETEEPDS